ncbi:hypothetical protein [uncultured Mucilaginibacter sp.]|uniref:hypothetical protein n=1 Tax=uncultured Mucilaginibacter sp. TaxID=797541 RepID=UPI0025E9833C|nr:hypothetical protein [uncultured Mucilaginibacter sp.]
MLKINLWILFSCAIVIGAVVFLRNNPVHDPGSKIINYNKALKSNAGTRDYSDIPEWYLRNRVQIHTRLSLNELNSSVFFGFPEELKKYNVTVLTRQIKARDEQPWWPTGDGGIDARAANYNSNGQNLAVKIIKQLHDLNMKAIIYYRHSEDSAMLLNHPDWACLNVKGEPIRGPRGIFLSFNSPYRDIVIARLKQLASYGADGFYFDQIHIPQGGDFSEFSKKMYKEKYGTDMAGDFRTNKLRFFEFRNNTIERFFTDLRTSLLPFKPVLLVSGDSWTNFTGLHMNSEFFQKFILKTEAEEPVRPYNRNMEFSFPLDLKETIPGFYLNAFFFSFMRDNSAGPPHVWCRDLKSADDAANMAAGIISLGGIANLDVDANPQKTNIDVIKVPAEWNETYGSYFKDLVPYANVGVLASENERNKFLGDPEAAWQKVLIPAINTFSKLYKSGIPVNVLSDATLNSKFSEGLTKIYCDMSLTTGSGRDNKLEDFSDSDAGHTYK